jgi:hypothetical protein
MRDPHLGLSTEVGLLQVATGVVGGDKHALAIELAKIVAAQMGS